MDVTASCWDQWNIKPPGHNIFFFHLGQAAGAFCLPFHTNNLWSPTQSVPFFTVANQNINQQGVLLSLTSLKRPGLICSDFLFLHNIWWLLSTQTLFYNSLFNRRETLKVAGTYSKQYGKTVPMPRANSGRRKSWQGNRAFPGIDF